MNYVGFLIDFGFDNNDKNMIKKGILRGETLLKQNKESFSQKRLCKLFYFIGNGYSDLYSLEFERKKGWQQTINNENLQQAKRYYREAIKNSNDVYVGLKKRIWTNYANCLDNLSRVMDGLFAYEEVLKIDPEFSMAIGNKAIAMDIFADISGKYRTAIYNNSYRMLKSVVNRSDLIKNGGKEAKYKIEKEIEKIESKIDQQSLLKEFKHETINISNLNPFMRFYIKFCIKNALFLNFHIHEEVCEVSLLDPVFINLLLPNGDETTFFKLAKSINQIKEDYAVARLLLVQSQYKTEDFDNISLKTTYVNTPDYNLSNIYVGLLKSAFKESYNILDKIARFINEYFVLGLPEDRNIYITSRNLWMDEISKNNWKLKLEILESNNPGLYAIYDISLDLDIKNGYYSNLRKMRNKLVHEKLIIHGPNWNGNEDDYNISYKKMLLRTIRLMKIVKGAIIYLINAVNLEERRKKGSIVSTGTINVNTNQDLKNFL